MVCIAESIWDSCFTHATGSPGFYYTFFIRHIWKKTVVIYLRYYSTRSPWRTKKTGKRPQCVYGTPRPKSERRTSNAGWDQIWSPMQPLCKMGAVLGIQPPHKNLCYLRFLSAWIVSINGQFSLIDQPLMDDNEAIVNGRILSSALLSAKRSQACPKCSKPVSSGYWNSWNCNFHKFTVVENIICVFTFPDKTINFIIC
jgi:hypothetical protein